MGNHFTLFANDKNIISGTNWKLPTLALCTLFSVHYVDHLEHLIK